MKDKFRAKEKGKASDSKNKGGEWKRESEKRKHLLKNAGETRYDYEQGPQRTSEE